MDARESRNVTQLLVAWTEGTAPHSNIWDAQLKK